MIRKFILLALLCSGTNLASAQQHIIPKPIEISIQKGWLDLSKGVEVHLANEGNATLDHSNKLIPFYKGSKESTVNLANEIVGEWNQLLGHKKSKSKKTKINLVLAANALNSAEGYNLTVDKHGIDISANSYVGLYYGLQSLRQFDIVKNKIQYTKITDSPAFSWRAFLLDVGRNYQPLAMIKEQIDVMSRYKMNVLHFHFTEDLAWRLISKKYPGLTDASVMRRWEGKYYTEAEFNELISYCEERNILLFPEIDMPGHSAAFKRFFKVDMQSDSGIMYIKDLLNEFRDTYPTLPYLHIGGDEVKITNKNFMPIITKYVEDLGYKMTMGWDPGSNLQPQTWKQLWMGGPKLIKEEGENIYVDSKHLYLNHMDPLETVTNIFHRKIGEQDKEHGNLIGATVCAWPDRAVAKPIDMFYQNAIYPGLLTFAERIWRGKGESNWTANIWPKATPQYDSFVEFENRLLHHKTRSFSDKPFPYVRQIGLNWDLIGPFNNDGNLEKEFPIELNPYAASIQVSKVVEGGTVILRHWWNDVVKGAIDNPKNNSTWYARTKIWSDSDAEKDFWIGFDNLSRSYESDSPELGTWDDRKSKVWVNGTEVLPPTWKQAGMVGALEKPLLDEGYSFREPTKISLKKGWNEVLLKMPVKTFNGKNWQNPAKYLFTFIQISN